MKSGYFSFKKEFFKWFQSFKTSMVRELTYKLNFILELIAPAMVFFLIQYNLWHSIYLTTGEEVINNYTLKAMIEYQFWIFISQIFSRTYFFSMNIAMDIRLGKISSFLLYPFSYISYNFTLFLSQKGVQFFIGMLTLSISLLLGWVDPPSFFLFLKFLSFIFCVTLYWFFMQLIIGFLSFWMENTWSLDVSLRFLTFFLSGSLLPLDFFPAFIHKILLFTPFPYLNYIPVKIIMGQEISFLPPLLIVMSWILVIFLFCYLMWKKGLKLYSGAGI